MENKQTAVEWLANQIAEIPNTYLKGDYGLIELSGVVGDKVYRINMSIIHLIDEAKAMETKQIREAYYRGVRDEWEGAGRDFEDYYNETYNKQ